MSNREHSLYDFNLLKFLEDLFCSPTYGMAQRMSHVQGKRMCVLLLLGGGFDTRQLSQHS